MKRFLGSVVILAVLAACTKTPDAAKNAEAPATPAATESAPAAAPSVAAPANSAPAEPANYGRLGSKCEYVDAPGAATVTAIADEPPNGDCKQPKKVTLDFVPDDPAAKPDARDKAFSLVVGGASFVAAGCLAAYKIAVGTKLKVVRRTITAGTCSPIIYEVPALSSEADINKCVAFCSK